MNVARPSVTRRYLFGATALVAVLPACEQPPSTESILPEDPKRIAVRLQSPAFAEGGTIPRAYTCDGSDTSPALEWSDVPARAKSLAFLVEDPDAPRGTWTHWVLFDVPPDVDKLPKGVPTDDWVRLGEGEKAARQGRNDFGRVGYGGPCPPAGVHHYVFRIYALDIGLNLGPGTTREHLLHSMRGHVLAEGRLTGTYSRR